MTKWEAKKTGVYDADSHGRCVAMRHPLASEEEWIENREIIACAPAMLESLQAAISIVENSDNADEHQEWIVSAKRLVLDAKGIFF